MKVLRIEQFVEGQLLAQSCTQVRFRLIHGCQIAVTFPSGPSFLSDTDHTRWATKCFKHNQHNSPGKCENWTAVYVVSIRS